MGMDGCIMRPKVVFFKDTKPGYSIMDGCIMRPKGQMFIVAGIILVMLLFSLSGLLSVYGTGQEKTNLESVAVHRTAENLMREYKNIAGVATMKGDVNGSAMVYLSNFSDMARDDAGARVLYAFAFSNGTSQKFSVTTGNYLDGLVNLTIYATDSTPSSFFIGVVQDRTNVTREFSRSSNVLINITLNYTDNEGSKAERMTLNASALSSVAAIFDIKAESAEGFARRKETYNRSW